MSGNFENTSILHLCIQHMDIFVSVYMVKKKDGDALVTCRREAMVGTFNVRTAREGYKRLELVTQLLENGK